MGLAAVEATTADEVWAGIAGGTVRDAVLESTLTWLERIFAPAHVSLVDAPTGDEGVAEASARVEHLRAVAGAAPLTAAHGPSGDVVVVTVARTVSGPVVARIDGANAKAGLDHPLLTSVLKASAHALASIDARDEARRATQLARTRSAASGALLQGILALARAGTAAVACEAAVAAALEILDADWCLLIEPDSEAPWAERALVGGPPPDSALVLRSAAGRASATGRPLVIDAAAPWGAAGLAVPIPLAPTVRAVLLAGWADPAHAPSEIAIAHAGALADAVARRLEALGLDELLSPSETSSLQRRLRRLQRRHDALRAERDTAVLLSRTDALTGLSNRRTLIEALESSLARARSEGTSPGLIVLDLDGFKQVNDRHGHNAGDAVLREVATRVASQAAPGDTVARWGGEELCVLMPDVDDEGALRRVAERVRKALADRPIRVGEIALTMTASLGAVRAEAGAWDADTLIDAADRTMYAAKSRGGNRVCMLWELELHEMVPGAQPEDEELLLVDAVARHHFGQVHADDVADLADQVADELGLPADSRRRARLGALLHDVGKSKVPDAVLHKPGPLTADEWALMRRHPTDGADMVERVAAFKEIAIVVRAHHERWDGTGYPAGLSGREIPLEARIVAACDAYCAMIRERIYRKARPHGEAISELQRCAGSHLDPAVVEALCRVLEAA